MFVPMSCFFVFVLGAQFSQVYNKVMEHTRALGACFDHTRKTLTRTISHLPYDIAGWNNEERRWNDERGSVRTMSRMWDGHSGGKGWSTRSNDDNVRGETHWPANQTREEVDGRDRGGGWSGGRDGRRDGGRDEDRQRRIDQDREELQRERQKDLDHERSMEQRDRDREDRYRNTNRDRRDSGGRDNSGNDRPRNRSPSSSASSIRVDDKVEAKCTGWTKYYKGEVMAVNRDGTFDIRFEDGERKRSVDKHQVRSLGSSSAGDRDQDRDRDRDQDRDRDRDRGRDSRTSSSVREGDKVEAKCTGWTKYYTGEITRVNSDDTYDIKFEDGERKRGVRKDQVRSLGGSDDKDRDRDSQSSIRKGDKVEAKCSGWTKYYKGEITAVNRDGTFDIRFEDGEQKRDVEKHLVRCLDKDRNIGVASSSTSSTIRQGDQVEAKCIGWTKHYKGQVTAVNMGGTFDIKFEDGERKFGVEKHLVRSLETGKDRDSDRSSSSSVREGDKVEAKCTGWTKYYNGEITRVNSDNTYDIKFEDGERKRGVRKDQVRSLGGSDDKDRDRNSSSSTKTRREGDRVKAKCTGWTKYYAGEITRVNSDGTYDIKFEDGEQKKDVREAQLETVDHNSDRERDRGSTGSSHREGDKVQAMCLGWTKYYKGEITAVNHDGTYDIKFEDGERKRNIDVGLIRGNGSGKEVIRSRGGGNLSPRPTKSGRLVVSPRPSKSRERVGSSRKRTGSF